MMIGIYYWTHFYFVKRFFILGFFGSILNTVGIVFIVNALAIGPAGSSTALCNLSHILLMFSQSIIYWKLPSVFEVTGMLFGIIGSLVLTVPQIFYNIGKLLNTRLH
jgi:hypothetical protein